MNAPFAEANGFRPGDGFAAVLNGRLQPTHHRRNRLSPEFIYTIGPGGLMPDDRRFGMVWMTEEAAAGAFGLQGAFNDVALELTRCVAEARSIAAVDTLLAPYGGTGAYGREDQVSHRFLDDELSQLRAMSWVMPPVFFLVAAFLVNLVLARLIALERSQIGLLKAVGYSERRGGRHYLKLAAAIGVLGIAIGWGFGWWAGQGMTRLYGEFFRFPYLVYVANLHTFAISALAGLVAVLSGALFAVRAALLLTPAVAMAPPLPVRFRRHAIDGLGDVLGLPTMARMILRSLIRWPGRAAFTLLGVAASVAILVGSLFTFDAVEFLIDESLFRANRQDATLTFNEARTEAAVIEVAAMPAVIVPRACLAVPVTLRNGPVERRATLEGRPPGPVLARLLDAGGPAGRHARARPADVRQARRSARRRPRRDRGGRVHGRRPRDPRRAARPAPCACTTARASTWTPPPSRRCGLPGRDRTSFTSRSTPPEIPALNAAVKATPGIAGMTLWTEVRAQLPRHHGRKPGDLDQHLLRARLADRHRGRLQRRPHPALRAGARARQPAHPRV